MRWLIQDDSRYGDTREIRRFALFPVKVGKYKVWLEFYVATERLQTEIGEYGLPYLVWKVIQRNFE